MSSLQRFLDRLSWMGDYESGGTTVTAIAFESGVDGTIAWFSTSLKATERVEPHLKYILERLQDVHTLSSGLQNDLLREIRTRCIDFSQEKVFHYSKCYCTLFRQCREVLETSDQLLGRNLAHLAELSQMPQQLCEAADQFRHSESLKTLSRRVSSVTSPSSWSLLRHYIGRLGSWHRAAQTLVDFACERHDMLRKVELRGWPTPKHVHAPLADDYTNLYNALSRMFSVREQEDLARSIEALQRLRHVNLDETFQREYRNKHFKPRVHAEAWLLEQFHRNGLAFVENYKYIGCSKPSCYCCSVYFQVHPGNFVQRPTHGNVWINWQLPLHQDIERQSQNASMTSAMTSKFRDDLKAQIHQATATQLRVPDSSTGLTLSNT